MSRARALLLVLTCFSLRAAEPLDVPFFRQEKNGCGAASVAMVAHYWGSGAPPPEQVYRKLYRAEQSGVSLADMRRYLEELGFQAFTLRGQWVDLNGHLSKGRPVIVGLKSGRAKRIHFAVLIGVDGDRVWLNDPTRKQSHHVKQADFVKQWESADRWLLLAAPGSKE